MGRFKTWLEKLPLSDKEVFELKSGTIRLTTPDRSTKEEVGPILSEEAARVVKYDGHDCMMTTVVDCLPNGANLAAPIHLDFFVRHGVSAEVNEDEELDQILKKHKVRPGREYVIGSAARRSVRWWRRSR